MYRVHDEVTIDLHVRIMAVICHLQYCAAVIQINDGLKESHLIQRPLWPALWTQVRYLARSEK
jgi:hypothetical protein